MMVSSVVFHLIDLHIHSQSCFDFSFNFGCILYGPAADSSQNYMSMNTIYTSDGPQVAMAIAQPAGTPQRSVVGGWGCELRSAGEGEGKVRVGW